MAIGCVINMASKPPTKRRGAAPKRRSPTVDRQAERSRARIKARLLALEGLAETQRAWLEEMMQEVRKLKYQVMDKEDKATGGDYPL